MRGDPLMPVTVRTFASSGEAAAALSSDRGARYLGGGTLVMRALNEGDVSISTIVRAERSGADADRRVGTARHDRRRRHLREDPGRARARPSCTPLPARSAVRRCATWAPSAAICSRRTPYGDFTVALLALDAVVSVQGGFGARDVPIEEFLQSRERQAGTLVLSVSCQKPLSADAFRYRKIARIKPKGGSVITLAAHLPVSGGRVLRRTDRAGLDGADANPRQGGRARARRKAARCVVDRCRRFGGRRRHLTGRQCARQRLVPARDRRRASATPVVRSGIGSS